MLASGVYLAFNAIGLSLIMISGIFQILMLVSAVLLFMAGSKLFNTTTYDFFRAKIIVSLIAIVSSFATPQLLMNSGHSIMQFGATIILIGVVFIASIILLRLTSKK